MTDDDRGEYLRMLEDEAKARYRRVDPVTWALERHMTPLELALTRLFRRLRR